MEYTLREAAEILGTSVDALRMKMQRGTLKKAGLDTAGRRLVELTDADLATAPQQASTMAELRRHADHLEGEVAYLREQNAALTKLLERLGKA